MAHEQVIRDYRAALERRNYARTTIVKRMSITRRWLAYWGDAWTVLDWHDVDAYGDTRTCGPSTWRDEVSHLSHFYRWAMRNELAPSDPTTLVERPRVAQRLPRPAAAHDYALMIDDTPPALFAMLELMAWSGLRCCEVAGLRWRDVDIANGSALIHGKGDRHRIVAVPRRVVRALAAIDAGSEYVFEPPHKPGPYQPWRVSQIIANHARSRGVNVTAHQLRHRFATMLLELVGELDVVQEALGHASIATTQIYAKTDPRRVRALSRRLDEFEYDHAQLFDV